MAPEPTWDGIPLEIKEYIVAYLDYKTRLRVRVCSKNDRDLVDACPLSLRSVELDTSRLQLEIKGVGESTKIRDNIVDNFFKVFDNRDYHLKHLALFCDPLDDVEVIAIKEQLLSKPEELPRIKVGSFQLLAHVIPDQEFCRIFQLIDPKYLKKILIHPWLTKNQEEYLIGTDIWKNAESVHFYYRQNIKIEDALHLNHFSTIVSDLTAVDAWKLINSFLNKETLKRQVHGFFIKYYRGATEDQIVAEFKIVPERVDNLRYSGPNSVKYSYRFRTKTEGLVLVVEMKKSSFQARELNGFICEEGK